MHTTTHFQLIKVKNKLTIIKKCENKQTVKKENLAVQTSAAGLFLGTNRVVCCSNLCVVVRLVTCHIFMPENEH